MDMSRCVESEFLFLCRDFPDCKFDLLIALVVMCVQRCVKVEIVMRY